MHRAERRVAVRDVAGEDAEAVDVGEPGEALLLLLHLAPDRIGLLLAPEDLGGDAGAGEREADVLGDLRDHVAGLVAQRHEAADDRRARLGVEDAEGDVLELVAHPLHAHPAGERREDVHRLARLAQLLLRRQVLDGAHVVQPVGELDQQDAQVLRHRHQQLAEVLGLGVLDRAELEVGELRHPVDQLGDLVAEAQRDLVVGRAGVLDRVVQQRGDDRGVVEPLLGEQDRDGDRVAEVGLARGAALAFVHRGAVVVGGRDQAAVRARVVGAHERGQRLDGHDPVGAGTRDRDDRFGGRGERLVQDDLLGPGYREPPGERRAAAQVGSTPAGPKIPWPRSPYANAAGI